MTTLSSGVLLKLLDGMKSGAAKPVGEHRTAVLQVTDIVPAELDEKDLFPKHGKFYVKVSDASHSIYATLPLAQADLVLSNKLHLGQFVHVDRLDPASPVPIIVGARPLAGRHPLVVGTPDPAGRAKSAAPRRGSWGPEQNAAIKPTTLNFDAVRMTPVKERPALSTPVKDRAGAATPARDRGAAATPGRERGVAASPAMSSVSVRRKSSSVLPRLIRSKSFVADRDQQQHLRIPKSPFPTEKSSVSCTASRAMRRVAKEEEPSSPPSDDELGSSATSTKKRPATATRVPVPGKLSLLGKDAIEQREQAQKIALEALRNASATDNVARIYKLFSEVSKTARPEAPATCFEGFLNFHKEAVQAVTDIEAVQAATSMAAAVASDEQQHEDAPPVLQEIAQNRAVVRRRGIGLGSVSKSVSFAPGTLDPKQDDGGGKAIRSSSASRKCLAMDKIGEDGGDEKRSYCSAPSSVTTTAHSALGSSLKLAKQIQAEAGIWFMDFLEAALETGLKKSKASAMGDGRKQSSCCCPQSVMLRVINWVEMEQSGGDSIGRKTRAAAVARKLRIKAKNPC
ncbi:unnamed protein product [Miscanthus lutarioriparius]|uniref:Uncharacterized protein n=1 Tax=Miscanthus lutarioriparius TaxID=422564 RepID=A0A811P874_9POAL|nr:unnamed protein product [Miscanthus lutarioriparius]